MIKCLNNQKSCSLGRFFKKFMEMCIMKKMHEFQYILHQNKHLFIPFSMKTSRSSFIVNEDRELNHAEVYYLLSAALHLVRYQVPHSLKGSRSCLASHLILITQKLTLLITNMKIYCRVPICQSWICVMLFNPITSL